MVKTFLSTWTKLKALQKQNVNRTLTLKNAKRVQLKINLYTLKLKKYSSLFKLWWINQSFSLVFGIN